LFFCFFIPIGGILFAVGVLAATKALLPSVFTVCVLLTLSSVAGSWQGTDLAAVPESFFIPAKIPVSINAVI